MSRVRRLDPPTRAAGFRIGVRRSRRAQRRNRRLLRWTAVLWQRTAMTSPSVCLTIVIPTFRRHSLLLDALSDLARQRDVDFEVVVVFQNDTTSEEIDELAAALPGRFRPFRVNEPNASLARNVGLSEARGDVVLFLDDDIRVPDPNFLSKHVEYFSDAACAGVYGQVLEVGQTPTDTPTPELIATDWGWRRLPANYSRRCRTRNGASNNLAVRRDWAIAVGGMDAWFERGARREESEFNLRYTKRHGYLTFAPDASLIHLSGEGGSRHWGHVRRTVPMHHIIGHWYFWLAATRDRSQGFRGAAIELRSISVALLRNPRTGADPFAFAYNLARAFWGFCHAFGRLWRGPRRLETLSKDQYSSLSIEQCRLVQHEARLR